MSVTRRKRLLTLEQLEQAAKEMVTAFRIAKIPMAAAGGYAMQIYGSDRMTADLDIVATRWNPSLPEGQRLTFGGYATRTESGIPVDVLVRADGFKKLYREAVINARSVRGVPIRVTRITHLAAMKLVAGRAKDDLDLDFLLVTMNPKEKAEAKSIVARHLGLYAVREFENRILEAEWKRSRDAEGARKS